MSGELARLISKVRQMVVSMMPSALRDQEKAISVTPNSVANSIVTDDQLAQHGLEMDPESGYVRWKRDSRDHPRNWSAMRKAYDTSLVMLFEFYT
ncbi:hypothetical protein BDV06DRAFT_205411 [Aspergillus oleicola]